MFGRPATANPIAKRLAYDVCKTANLSDLERQQIVDSIKVCRGTMGRGTKGRVGVIGVIGVAQGVAPPGACLWCAGYRFGVPTALESPDILLTQHFLTLLHAV